MMTGESNQDRTGGPFQSLKELGRTVVDILHTRFDLLVTEIAEEQNRLAELLLYAALALFCLSFAVAIVVTFVVASVWDTPYRVPVTGVIAAVFIITGVTCAVTFVRKLNTKPRIFSTSLEALGVDQEHLK